MVEIKTISGNRVYAGYHCINFGIDYLSNVSDKCLSGTFAHEIGHMMTYKPIIFKIIITTIILILLCLILPFYLIPSLWLIFYLLFCYYLRKSEYVADKTALDYTDYNSMVIYLYEGATRHNRLNQLFYLFCYHPNIVKRYNHLCKSRVLS